MVEDDIGRGEAAAPGSRLGRGYFVPATAMSIRRAESGLIRNGRCATVGGHFAGWQQVDIDQRRPG